MKKLSILINGLNYLTVTNIVRKLRTNKLSLFLGFLIISCVMCSSFVTFSNSNEKEVTEAFNLRIDGKANQAEKLLKELIKKDPTDASAHFELARTLNYMNMRGSTEADSALQKALELEPDNVVYAYYNAKSCFLKAYIAMHQGNEAKEHVNKACDEFLKVLELKSDYPEPLMYLVETYGYLPENMGGNKNKAEQYQKQLEKLDKFYGAKSKLVLMDENTDKVEYWNNYIRVNGENCAALKELGNAHIFNDDIDKAKEAFNKATELDKSQNIRLLDLARFHMMKVMQNRDLANKELPKAKVYIDQYLATNPIAPLHAYALGMKVKTEMFTGNKEAGEKLMAEAKSIDPYFSRAFGVPSMSIFEPPTQIDHHFQSFFSPF